MGVFPGKHRQIVQVIADGKNLVFDEAKTFSELCQRGSFVVRGVAEPRIYIVSNDREVLDAQRVFPQEFMDEVGFVICAGDQTKR